MFRVLCLSLLFVTPAIAGNYTAKAVGSKFYRSEGSKDYRAVRQAMAECEGDGFSCREQGVRCLDPKPFKCKRWSATVVGTQEFTGYGSKPYRAERDAMAKCGQSGLERCRIVGRFR